MSLALFSNFSTFKYKYTNIIIVYCCDYGLVWCSNRLAIFIGYMLREHNETKRTISTTFIDVIARNCSVVSRNCLLLVLFGFSYWIIRTLTKSVLLAEVTWKKHCEQIIVVVFSLVSNDVHLHWANATPKCMAHLIILFFLLDLIQIYDRANEQSINRRN